MERTIAATFCDERNREKKSPERALQARKGRQKGREIVKPSIEEKGRKVLSEINQTEKDKYCEISLTCIIFKNPQNTKLIEKEIRLVVIRGGGLGQLDECGQKV